MKPRNVPYYLARMGLIAVLLLVTVVLSNSALGGSFHMNSTNSNRIKHITTPITHIIYMLKENHTFDNLFGLFPGVNGATTGLAYINHQTVTVPMNIMTNNPKSYCHNFKCAGTAVHGGAMNGFNLNAFCTQPPYPCYSEAQQSLIPNYWAYAQNYLLDDNAFSSLLGPSYPNHLYTMAGASGPDIQHSVINNPGGLPWAVMHRLLQPYSSTIKPMSIPVSPSRPLPMKCPLLE